MEFMCHESSFPDTPAMRNHLHVIYYGNVLENLIKEGEAGVGKKKKEVGE